MSYQQNNIAQSVFEKHYDNLSESKQDLLNQKYNCSICFEIIKHENPFMCYVCQKLFHQACLKNWNERQKQLRKALSCPNCRNELPWEKWKEKRNHDENRTQDAEILAQLGKNFNPDEYSKKSINLFKVIINKLNSIHSVIESQQNVKLNNLNEEFKSNLINPSIDEISSIIIEELELIEKHVENYKKDNKKNNKREETIYKNEINLKFIVNDGGKKSIFGKEFVKNNSDNISLIINGKKTSLAHECNLKEGENIITLCIKKKLINLNYMFGAYDAYNMKCNLDELKYLNTEDVTSLRYCFMEVPFVDAKPIGNWDVSNCKDFQGLFMGCKNLSDLTSIQNWDVSNGVNFSQMFQGCSQLSDIKPLEYWNTANGNEFCMMFESTKISSLYPLRNWNVSKGDIFGGMFSNCCSLKNLEGLEKWDVSKGTIFNGMFSESKFLSDIKSIENWNVSKGIQFECMIEKTKR